MDIFHFNSLKDLDAFSQKKKDDHLLFIVGQPGVEATKKLALLIEAGANVNMACDYSGLTPLIAAVTNGDIAKVALLIQAGAKLSTPNQNHETAFSRAIAKKYSDVAFLLFYMMSKDDLNQEVKLHYLRLSIFEFYCVDITLPLEKLTEQKNLLLAKALVPLLPSSPNAPTLFSILPIELKHFICFKYWAVTQNTMLQTFCSMDAPKPLIFSLDLPKVKKHDEHQQLYTQFSALSTEDAYQKEQEERKSKKRKGCIIS